MVQAPAGYLISGVVRTPTGAAGRIGVSRTNATGHVPAGFFNNVYTLFSPTGAQRNVIDAKAFDWGAATVGLGVAGVCSDPGGVAQQHVYYMRLNANGAPLPAIYYRTPNDQRYRLHSVKRARFGNFVYLAGEAVSSTMGTNRVFVLKLTVAGAIVWGFTYTDALTPPSVDRAYDVMEDPNTNMVAVVGTTTNNTNGTDAFLLYLNINTGIPGPPMRMYGTNFSFDQFTAIEYATDPAGPFGYIIGGHSNANAANNIDAWALRMNNAMAINWTRLVDYQGMGVANFGRDVLETVANNVYEYYVGGYTANGVLGGPDMVVDKYSAAGGMVFQGTYGNTSPQLLSTIDKNAVNDITLFGQSVGPLPIFGNNDFCIFKTKANGITACDYKISDWQPYDGPKENGTKSYFTKDIFTRTEGPVQFSSYRDTTICDSIYVPVITPKSANGKDLELNIYSAGETGMTVAIANAENAPAELTVTDITGRILYQAKVMLQESTTYVTLNIGGQVSNGIYLITLRQGAHVETRKVLISK